MNINWFSLGMFIVSSLLIPAFVSWYSSDLRVAARATKRIFEETRYRFVENEYPAWHNIDPKYTNVATSTDGIEIHHWESWGENIILHENIEDAENIIRDFKALVDDGIFKERIHSIIVNEKKLIIETANLAESITSESEKISLGEDMKGTCSICKHFSIFSKIIR